MNKKISVENAEVSDAPKELMDSAGVISEEISIHPKLTRPKKPSKIAQKSGTKYPGYKLIKDFGAVKNGKRGRHFIFILEGKDWVQYMVNIEPYFDEVIQNAEDFYNLLRHDLGLDMKRVSQNPNISDDVLVGKAKRMIIAKREPEKEEVVEEPPAKEESEPDQQEFPFASDIDDGESHKRAIMAWFDRYRTITADSTWTQDQVYCEDGDCYDVEKITEITEHNNVERVKVESLSQQLFENAWGDDKVFVSPMSVMKEPLLNVDHKVHMRRIRTANLEKPILIRFSDGKVIDGYHRLSRALLEDKKYISAIYIQDEQMEDARVKS